MSAPSDLRDVETADVYKGDLLAGRLTRHGDNIEFTYDTCYLSDTSVPDVAWSIPKTRIETSATSGSVPPFFAGLLPEGIRLAGAVTSTKTSADDHLTILLAVGSDTIGDVRVVPQGTELSTASTAFDPPRRTGNLVDHAGIRSALYSAVCIAGRSDGIETLRSGESMDS